MTSWYSIEIASQSDGVTFFNGYFSVNNTSNLVTGFYETINGNTDFNENILIPTGSGSYQGVNPEGFNYYSFENYFYDNAFLSSWFQFDTNGVLVSSVSAYPQYNTFNFFAQNQDQTISNIGLVTHKTVLGERVLRLDSLFTINPVSDPSCFNEGTKILCENEYIAIENLRKGDLVKTYNHGYRKIDLIGKNRMINNPDTWHGCMYKMKKTAQNGILEDLIITGGHSVLVDDLGEYKQQNEEKFGGTQMIDDKYLLLSAISNDFTKIEGVQSYTYYHFTLENDGNDDQRFGVWANGVLTETPSKNCFITHKYI